MTSATPTTLGASGARRNRVVLLALLPLIVFALGACVYWVQLILLLTFSILILVFPPILLGGPVLCLSIIWATFVGLASLGSMLWDGASARRWRRAALAAPLGLAYIALWHVLFGSFAKGDMHFFWRANEDWFVAALWAHAAYPLVACLMASLILLPERATSRVSVWRGLLAIGLVWALLLTALGPALGWARADLRSRSMSLLDVIPTNNPNPFVVAVCAGRLAKAAELFRAQSHQLGESDVSELQTNCLSRHHIPRSYAARVGLVLDATLAWEARGATQARQGCTKYQKSLLRDVYKIGFPGAAIQAFVARGLPITCPLEPGESEPVWWPVLHNVYAKRTHQLGAPLPRLQALGIDLRQTDSKGLDLVAANPNGFISSASDADLLSLAELGLQDQPGARTPHTLVIEVMQRRHKLGVGDAASPDLARAFQQVGAPTDEQLREVMERDPWMLSGKPWMLEGGSRRLETYSDIQRDRERRLRDVIERQRDMERQLRYGAF